ncbi:amidohydrolase family protein [Maribacter polysiphoniae]|uniref:Amidohydrolase family protein n=1 Tax=Maribacter polysiphoniae TaxID=429344 RepID=A0A316E250_9FLAO|nr:amidohydrolase family protein [Maribacter polysiphoniae]MBD1258990.1 amidohydrolase family protein [Maribacter polysiphoniae]PWK24544.1 imidazolonepropionase-like amidohydrolase [Maribacter polysiphoniae]
MKYLKTLILFAVFSFNVTAQHNSKSENKQQGNATYVIKNVNVIPMTKSNKIIENATVVILDQKILSINGTIPNNAKIIDGTGKWLIPGLVDMHVHTNADLNFRENSPTQGATFFMDTQDVMTTYIANGVTTIFELGGRVEHFGQRNEIAKGKVIGPRMAIAPMINGGDPNNGGRIVNNASDARQAVRSVKAEGYNFIKAYSQLNIESFQAIVDEAQKQGLKVVGHIPDAFKGQTEKAFVPNFGLVAHAEEFSKQIRNQAKTKKEAQYFAQLSKDNDTWLTPNLIAIVKIRDQVQSLDSIRLMETLKYVHPILQDKWLTSNNYHKHASPEFIDYLDSLITFHKEMVVAFKDAGVPILAGTDAGVSGIVTGFSLHDELALLVDAGLTNEEALMAATRLPATWLEIDDAIGTVEVGKFADLVLLDANPLIEINNTRKIYGVFVNGRWIDNGKIENMLSDLAKWNSEMKNKFKWKKRREY